MTVKELINELKNYQKDLDVCYAWDGAIRSDVRFIWVSRSEQVVLSDGDVIYDTSDRPHYAPTSSKDEFWRPKK